MDDQRDMQQLAGSRKGTEQHGVANIEDTYERRPTQPLPITIYGIQPMKTFGNATVYEVHDESQANNGEPNHRYGNSNAPLVKGDLN